MGLNNIREKKSHEIRIIVAAAGIAVFFAILFTVVTGRSQNFDDSLPKLQDYFCFLR